MKIGEQIIVMVLILASFVFIGLLAHQIELLDARITNIEMAK